MHCNKLGIKGEELTAIWLNEQGFTILARNYQTRYGEIDIIACKQEVIAFIEVKTRSNTFFPIMNTVPVSKQQRLIKTAHHYIVAHNIYDKVFRFDIAFIIQKANSKPSFTYLENAFFSK